MSTSEHLVAQVIKGGRGGVTVGR